MMADERDAGAEGGPAPTPGSPAVSEQFSERQRALLYRIRVRYDHVKQLEGTTELLKADVMADLAALDREEQDPTFMGLTSFLDHGIVFDLQGWHARQRVPPPPNLPTPGGIRRSSVELYRSGALPRPPYDLWEPTDNAIWTVLQLYLAFLERRRLSAETANRKAALAGATPLLGNDIPWPAPWQLEEHLARLRALAEDPKSPLSDRQREARAVFAALFGPERDQRPLPANALELAERQVEQQVIDGTLSQDQALGIVLRLMINEGLGKLLSQAEAARYLGVSSTTVKMWIRARRLPEVRIGHGVFVPVYFVEQEKTRRGFTRNLMERETSEAEPDEDTESPF